MSENIAIMFRTHEMGLDPQATKPCTELLAQTIAFLEKQIENAERLIGADRADIFLRAIEAHIADKLSAELQASGEQ
jgi:hypothetical protein